MILCSIGSTSTARRMGSSAIRRLRNTIHARTSPSSSSSKVTSSKRLSSSCSDETITSKRLRPRRVFMPVAWGRQRRRSLPCSGQRRSFIKACCGTRSTARMAYRTCWSAVTCSRTCFRTLFRRRRPATLPRTSPVPPGTIASWTSSSRRSISRPAASWITPALVPLTRRSSLSTTGRWEDSKATSHPCPISWDAAGGKAGNAGQVPLIGSLRCRKPAP